MSVTLGKPSDPEPLYIAIEREPDGRIANVTVTTDAPDPEHVWTRALDTTVWTTPAPEYDDYAARAVKVLDLSLSGNYRDHDGHTWSEGERKTRAFHARSNQRAALRTIEAHLIRAGHLDVTTGIAQCQNYGLTVITGNHHGGHHVVSQRPDGTWEIAMQDTTDDYGWACPDTLAPATASPRAVATAILAHVYDGVETRGELRPLARLRVAYRQWRRIPHWRNFKYRAGLWQWRMTRRVTVRLPRR
ncbi:hypothetical protein [Streptomyces sp. NPDC004267]|uniref:hypothetical protein n=1 Tax=Streptomyces sp. NPDC004267 TaxID=3364694 RepID=UPI00367AAC78